MNKKIGRHGQFCAVNIRKQLRADGIPRRKSRQVGISTSLPGYNVNILLAGVFHGIRAHAENTVKNTDLGPCRCGSAVDEHLGNNNVVGQARGFHGDELRLQGPRAKEAGYQTNFLPRTVHIIPLH